MTLCWCVATYGRPHLLPRVIAAFESQTYGDRYMVIFDDGGQLPERDGDRWELLSTPQRCASLGLKRNQIARVATDDIGADGLLMVDDDDLPMPWHTAAAAAALSIAEWSRPSQVLVPADQGFQAIYTGHRDDPARERLFHPAWAIRSTAFWRVGGYPDEKSGNEDQGLMWKLEAAGVSQADPIELGFGPSYVYDWGHGNISGLLNRADPTGAAAWKRLARQLEPCELARWDPPFDLHHPTILPGVLPRPF